MGHYNSVRHEFLLIGGKGKSTPDVKKLVDSVISIERSDKHSEKPIEFIELIDNLKKKRGKYNCTELHLKRLQNT